MVTTGYWGSSMHIKFMTLNNGLQVLYTDTVCTMYMELQHIQMALTLTDGY